jgi:hypothetical protein
MIDKLFESLSPEQQREDRKLRTLQRIVDTAGRRIVAGRLSHREAEELAEQTRSAAQNIIPDQMDVYDLIYGARFRRWIEQFCNTNHRTCENGNT